MQFFQTLQASHTHLIWAPLLLQNFRAHADRTNTLYEVGGDFSFMGETTIRKDWSLVSSEQHKLNFS